MRRRIVFALATVLVAACGRLPVGKGTTIPTSSGRVELDFPAGWFRNTEKHPFDLQCFSWDQRLNTAVFEFDRADLAKDYDASLLLDRQVQDLRSKRQNFTLQSEKTAVELPDKTLTTVVHSGEKDSLRNLYSFTLIEFKGRPAPVLVVLQVATPSQWEKSRSVLQGITASARVRPSSSSP
jgi:hypothetical protein